MPMYGLNYIEINFDIVENVITTLQNMNSRFRYVLVFVDYNVMFASVRALNIPLISYFTINIYK